MSCRLLVRRGRRYVMLWLSVVVVSSHRVVVIASLSTMVVVCRVVVYKALDRVGLEWDWDWELVVCVQETEGGYEGS